MYTLKALQPVRCGPKLRLGKSSDGGYVLLESQPGRTRLLLSFGVATDWSFEEAFLGRNPECSVMMFDRSISFPLILLKFAAKTVKLDFRKAGHYISAAWKFVRFIAARPNVRFIRKFIGPRSSPAVMTIDEVFGLPEVSTLPPAGVYLKMDIEGSEYDVLGDVLRLADRVNGIAVEFHDLARRGRDLDVLVARLRARFHVVHVHGNNFTGLVPGTGLPDSLEVTFVNRSLVDGEPEKDAGPWPADGLDFPNDPARPDFPLDFTGA